jgi:hypothetical protein
MEWAAPMGRGPDRDSRRRVRVGNPSATGLRRARVATQAPPRGGQRAFSESECEVPHWAELRHRTCGLEPGGEDQWVTSAQSSKGLVTCNLWYARRR